MSTAKGPRSSRSLQAAILVAIAAWGIYLAIGAYLYNHDPWRAAIVVVCFALFLGFWIGLLSTWHGPTRREPPE